MPEEELTSPVAGTVVSVLAAGERVAGRRRVAVIESMKMEYEVLAESGGEVLRVDVAVGELVADGQALATISPGDVPARVGGAPADASLEAVAPGMRSGSMRRGPTRSRGGASRGGGPRARTSPTWSMTGRSSSTGRCCSRRRSGGGRARS